MARLPGLSTEVGHHPHLSLPAYWGLAASFVVVLSEARKYPLNLTMENRDLAQLDETTAAALFSTAGTFINFSAGAD
jgi:hypothetical protein